MSTLITVRHLEERLTIVDGELRNCRAGAENFPVVPDVVPKDLGENPPLLESPNERLVTPPDAPLHRQVLNGIHSIFWTFDFVRMPAVAVIGLDLLAGLEEVHENGIKDFYDWPLTGWVGSLDPHKLALEDVHPELIAQGELPHVLVGTEGIPFLRDPLLWDAKVRPVDGH